MPAPSPSQLTRSFGMALAAAGALSVVGARAVSDRLARQENAPDPRMVVALGIRQLGQGALLATAPDPVIARLGSGVDVTHAATMVVAAMVWPHHRRAAVLSGPIAAASALVGMVLARHQTHEPR